MAARAVRADRGRGLGQDLGDGRAGGLPRARRARPRRRPRRDAGQRLVPDVHEQGDRQPAAAGAPVAVDAGPARGRRARDHELPRVRRVAAGSLRRARGVRAGLARVEPSPARGAVRPGARPHDVRARGGHVPAVARQQDPRDRRPAAEPPRGAGRRPDVARPAARRVEEPSVGSVLQGGAGADRADRGRRDLPRAQGRARGDRLRRPDRPRDRDRRRGSPTSSPTIARGSRRCCSTSTRTRTSRRHS